MKTIKILLSLLCTACAGHAQLPAPNPPTPISIANDFLVVTASLSATQGSEQLYWDGGRTSVIGGQALFVEHRTPAWLRDMNLNTSLVQNDFSFTWSFIGASGSPPTFPLTTQGATVAIGDIDWRNASGATVESGLAGVEILGGNWRFAGGDGYGYHFAYTGPATISSLADLAFSVRLFNSTTIPEPSVCAVVGVGAFAWACSRRKSSKN